MQLYEYMVLYELKKGNGKGRICITRKRRIKTYSDVESIDEFIKEYNGLDVYVVDFKLLRTYEKED